MQAKLAHRRDRILKTAYACPYAYLIGVDGGGTGTRLRVTCADGSELGYASSGPSALVNGVQNAWTAVLAALNEAFAAADTVMPPLAQLAIGLGLAGVHNRQWAAAFKETNPGFGALALDTDGFTTLLGAHAGQPGAVIAIGTGSIGEIWTANGERREVGGWGFPASDEAGGAWLGLHAINLAQRMLDGRAAHSAFGTAVVEFCGGTRDSLLDWLAQARQTQFASVAPLVVQHAEHDAFARELMLKAGREITAIAAALDPSVSVPLALCGSLAAPLQPYLPADLQARARAPQADAVSGAQRLLQRHLEGCLVAR